MSDYLNFPLRAVDVGLDLRDVVDKVSEGKWTRLTNVRSTQEALIATREGRSLVVDYSTSPILIDPQVHSIRKIGTSSLAVGVGTQLFKNGSQYVDTSANFSGNPLSLVSYRPLVSPSNWIYVADSNKLRKINEDGRIYQWGVTRPPGVVSASAAGTGGLDTSVGGAIAYKWRATYYSDVTGAESNPSDEMTTGLTGTGVAANLGISGSNDPQVTHVRFYRTGGTNTTGVYRLDVAVTNIVGTTVSATSTQTDSAISLSRALESSNDVPFTSVGTNGSQVFGVALPYAAGPFLGKYILAVGDPNRPGYLYWTNPENPDGAASTNNVQITTPSEPLLGVLIYDGRPFVWSRDNLYEVEFGIGAITFRGRLTPCGRGLSAPWAYCVGPAIYFLSKDGIYRTTGDSPAECITDDSLRPLFQGQTVGGMAPVDWLANSNKYMRMWYAGQELHFTYRDTEGVHQHLYWNSQYERWKRLSQAGLSIISGYSTENTSAAELFLGTREGQVYFSSPSTGLGLTTSVATTDDGDAIAVNLRTGAQDQGATATLKQYGGLIVDADVPTGVTISITAILNGRDSLNDATYAFAVGQIVGGIEGRRKYAFTLERFPGTNLAAETYAYNIAFDLAWTGIAKVYQMEVLWRPDEEEIVHWEFPPTSHGLSGWQQLRDLYLTLRSNADLTLTITGDEEQVDTYTVPSTAGLKLKRHVKLAPRKAKVFQYKLDTLDSTKPFRVYGDDCELRLKVWNTNMGYDLVSPFKKAGTE